MTNKEWFAKTWLWLAAGIFALGMGSIEISRHAVARGSFDAVLGAALIVASLPFAKEKLTQLRLNLSWLVVGLIMINDGVVAHLVNHGDYNLKKIVIGLAFCVYFVYRTFLKERLDAIANENE